MVLLQYSHIIDDILQLVQEPGVDLGQLIDTFHAVTLHQSLRHSEDAQVGRVRQLLLQVVEVDVVVAHKSVHTLANHTQTLLHDLLKALTNRHDLADRLHAGANLTAHAHELGQIPTRDLYDHIIYLRGFVSGVGRTHLANLVQTIT